MRSGFVAIVGAPNVGKSTFLNQVLGFKLAITSDKPQTTRHRLLGVYNAPDMQLAFLDTPGLHQPTHALNKLMVETALAALEDVEAVLFMVDVGKKGMEEGREVAKAVLQAGRPTILGLNKIDLLPRKQALLPLIEEASSWGDWRALVPVSALKGEGAQELVHELAQALPEGEPMFPPDMMTDLSVRFLASELIREKIFRLTRQELPYSTAVTIDQFLEPEQEGGQVAITATIHVERSGQKAIVIGKGGQMIKEIGTRARQDIQTLLGQPVFLDLFVRVEPKWSRGEHTLRKLGY